MRPFAAIMPKDADRDIYRVFDHFVLVTRASRQTDTPTAPRWYRTYSTGEQRGFFVIEVMQSDMNLVN
jgi:hypothetical protein